MLILAICFAMISRRERVSQLVSVSKMNAHEIDFIVKNDENIDHILDADTIMVALDSLHLPEVVRTSKFFQTLARFPHVFRILSPTAFEIIDMKGLSRILIHPFRTDVDTFLLQLRKSNYVLIDCPRRFVFEKKSICL